MSRKVAVTCPLLLALALVATLLYRYSGAEWQDQTSSVLILTGITLVVAGFTPLFVMLHRALSGMSSQPGRACLAIVFLDMFALFMVFVISVAIDFGWSISSIILIVVSMCAASFVGATTVARGNRGLG